ncbi:MAG: hypothetical protein QXT69_05120 [Fervidicoccaceae archaeon]
MEFEARYIKFIWVRNISLLNEKAIGILRMKHIVSIFMTIVLLWGGHGEGLTSSCMGLSLLIFTALSALLSNGAMSFESKIIALLYSFIELLLNIAGRRDN